MRRAVVPIVLLVAVAWSACAPKPPSALPTAPRYPAFVFPGVPEELAAQAPLAERHTQAWQRLQSGDLRAAERDFRWVTGQSATYFPSETGLGYVALARKDYKRALQHFELGLAVAPRYAPALVGRGDALIGLGRQGEAAANFEAALAADPSLAELRGRVDALRFKGLEDQIAAARKAREAGRLDEAVRAYQGAIAASPESGFLHRELAVVEQRLGRNPEALEHVRRAIALDPGDARARLVAGEILESQQQYPEAVAEYEAAATIEDTEDVRARLAAARRRAEIAALPPEYHAIPSEPSITRAQLAALIGVRFEDLLRQAPDRPAPVLTDSRGVWAASWIGAVVRAGVIDPFPNHTFQPELPVRRSDLALALSRLLPLAAAGRPDLLARWREGRPTFPDLPPSHLGYPAAALTVEAGVLSPQPGNAFAPGQPVAGAEAIEAMDRVEALWRGQP